MDLYESENKGIVAKFLHHPVHMKAKSAEAGRPIFEDFEYIRINIIGDRNSEVFRRATERDKMLYAAQYQAFKNNEDSPMNGTPMAEWPAVTKSQCEELKFYHIRTVEDFVDAGEERAKGLGMGYLDLFKKAKAFVEVSGSDENLKLAERINKVESENSDLKKLLETKNSNNNGAELEKVKQENAELQETVADLKEQISDLRGVLADTKDAAKPAKGKAASK